MKVLFVTEEVTPYMPETTMSTISRYLPQGIQEQKNEVRIFTPRYGCINERRHQLHEVIRLSGLNMIINDSDHPLLIKVASIQSARMQVYFIDNEEYFERKQLLTDEEGTYFADNDERSIFFARGTLETIRRLRWKPDIIHCHGWFTGIVPLYVKHAYKEDPLFQNTKVVYSLYEGRTDVKFDPRYKHKAVIDGVTKRDLSHLDSADYVGINKLAMQFSDAFVFVGENQHPDLKNAITSGRKPYITHVDETYIQDYHELYKKIAAK